MSYININQTKSEKEFGKCYGVWDKRMYSISLK